MINYLNIATGYNCKSDYMKKLNCRKRRGVGKFK